MTLKSRKSIDIAGPDLREETVVHFRKEPNKTYTKVTKVLTRDLKTGIVKGENQPGTEEGPYKLTQSETDCDEKVEYLDFDGNTRYMCFKRVE